MLCYRTYNLFLKTVADAINAALGAGAYNPNQGSYAIDCGVAKTGPPLQLITSAGTFSIPASICKLYLIIHSTK